MEEFDDIQPIFTLQHPHTTAALSRLRRADNVCVTDSIDVESSFGEVFNDCDLFSHFPVLADIQFDT